MGVDAPNPSSPFRWIAIGGRVGALSTLMTLLPERYDSICHMRDDSRVAFTASAQGGASACRTSNDTVEHELTLRLKTLEDVLGADCLVIFSSIVNGVEVAAREALEVSSERRERLAVVLETRGGYIEVAEKIVGVLRAHYKQVDFFVPSFAMSAGTVLAMSGDAIHMDYASYLGPIDPQVGRSGNRDGPLVPALGYLRWYDRLVKKSATGKMSTAELAFMMNKFDPAELYYFEQARNLSISLLKEWLVKYKFKDWKKTQTRGKMVSRAMKVKRAEEIAKLLNDTDRWHSHSRAISMDALRTVAKLEIEDFGKNKSVKTALRNYERLLRDYVDRRGMEWVLHTSEVFVPLRPGAK